MRRLLLLAALLAAPALASAQEPEAQRPDTSPAAAPARPPPGPWRVSVATGVGGFVEILDAFAGGLAGGLDGYHVERTDRMQLGVRVDREHGWLRLGVGYTQQRWSKQLSDDSGRVVGTLDDTLHLVLADALVRWVRPLPFGALELYGGAGMGAAVHRESGTVNGEPRGARASGIAFQLRLLGVAIGGEHLRVFGEVGVGFEGLLVGGVTWRI